MLNTARRWVPWLLVGATGWIQGCSEGQVGGAPPTAGTNGAGAQAGTAAGGSSAAGQAQGGTPSGGQAGQGAKAGGGGVSQGGQGGQAQGGSGQAGTSSGGQGGQEQGGSSGTSGQGGAGGAACNVWEVFENNGCTSCHGANGSAALNLTDPASATSYLMEGTSRGNPCFERYVNPDDPGSSLLLRMMDAKGFDAATTCAPRMPPVESKFPTMGASDRACVEQWIAASAKPPPAADFEASDPATYARKVKTLVNGGAVTAAELAQLGQDPTKFRAMIAGWMDEAWGFDEGSPYASLFEARLGRLLMRELQQQIFGGMAQFQLRYTLGGAGHTLKEPRLLADLQESSERTLLGLVRDGRPLTDVATNDEWYVTTAMLTYLTYFEQTSEEMAREYRVFLHPPSYYSDPANLTTATDENGKTYKAVRDTIDGVEYLDPAAKVQAGIAQTGLTDEDVTQNSLAKRAWLWSNVSSGSIIVNVNSVPPPPAPRPDQDGPDDNLTRCRSGNFKQLGHMLLDARGMLELVYGKIFCRGSQDKNSFDNETRFLTEADYHDWRKVKFTVGSDTPLFYHTAALRKLNGNKPVALRRPHVGFFSTEAFFANWITNPDNTFRVTTNQSLIAALGSTITEADPTVSPAAIGISEDHSAKGTACYSCHRVLDPMRSLFASTYTPDYFPHGPLDPGQKDGEFSFLGQSFAKPAGVSGEVAFGQAIAAHPRFAEAWVQKMCRYANSRDCDERDPVFVKLAADFKASNFNLRTLLLDLLSSPLVTHAKATASDTYQPVDLSITRREHFCFLLQNRLGKDVCAIPSFGNLMATIPNDAIARGEPRVQQATQSGAFYSKTMDIICDRLAGMFVTNTSGFFYTPGQEPDFASLVSQFMSVPPGSPRHDAIVAALSDHYHEACQDPAAPAGTCLKDGAKRLRAARSTFLTACVSPDVLGIGF